MLIMYGDHFEDSPAEQNAIFFCMQRSFCNAL